MVTVCTGCGEGALIEVGCSGCGESISVVTGDVCVMGLGTKAGSRSGSCVRECVLTASLSD